VLVERLKDVDAFVVFDLDDAPVSAGVVRSAPKILVDGATWLARTATYQFASFGIQAGGASAGVNASPDARRSAIESFVAEVRPWVESRRFVPDAAKGVATDDFVALRDVDPRPAGFWDAAPDLLAATIVASTELAADGLDGRTVAIEGFDHVGVRTATELGSRGARIVAIGTAGGTALQESGFDVSAVAAAWQAHGTELVRELSPEPGPAGEVLGVEADVLIVGSRAGVIDHGVAAGCSCRVVVPSGPIPVTAKGLAVLRRQGVRVLPDFITTAGAMLGGLAPGLDGASGTTRSVDEVSAQVREVLGEVLDHEQGPVLGACHRAETFLRTWREQLPFGRPLA
jgi:glutamate dehydrogenase (NAD(P)+)